MSAEQRTAADRLTEQIEAVQEAQRHGLTDALQRVRGAATGVPASLAGMTIKRGREYENGPIHHANDGCGDHA
jgi:hypothetical protein